MLTAILWIAWLTFATGEAFGVAALSPEECEVKTHALVTHREAGRRLSGYPVHCILEVEPMQVMGRMLGAPVAPRQLKAHEPDSGDNHPDNIPQSPESVRTGEGPSSAREPDRGSSANEPAKAGDEPARELFCSQCTGPRPCPIHDASPDGELIAAALGDPATRTPCVRVRATEE